MKEIIYILKDKQLNKEESKSAANIIVCGALLL